MSKILDRSIKFILTISFLVFASCNTVSTKSAPQREVAQDTASSISWLKFNSELPKCPLMGGRPPEDMPVSGLVVPGIGSYLSEEDIVAVAVETILAMPNSPTRIFIVQGEGQANPLHKILERIDSSKLTSIQKQAAQKRVSVLTTSQSPIVWNQDYIHSTIGPGDTRARIYYLQNYDSSKSKDSGQTYQSFQQFIKSATQSNDFKQVIFQEMPNINISPVHAGHYGGNVLTLPNGNCLIGKSRFANNEEALTFAKSVGCENEILTVDTSWLNVSHIDELISYLSSNGNICKTSFRIPSTNLAKTLMQRYPNNAFFQIEELDSSAHQNIGARMSAIQEVREACVEKYKSIGSWCFNLTNNDILKYSQNDFWKTNDAIQKKINETRKSISDFIKKTNGCTPHFIESPQLFSANIEDGEINQATTIHSNAVNSVLVSNVVFTPKTGNKAFDDWNKDLIEGFTHKIIFLNTFRANLSGGNAHCLIKTIRSCNPQRQ